MILIDISQQTFSDRKAFPVSGWSRPLTLMSPMAPRALEQVISCNEADIEKEPTTKDILTLRTDLSFVFLCGL